MLSQYLSSLLALGNYKAAPKPLSRPGASIPKKTNQQLPMARICMIEHIELIDNIHDP